MSYSENMDIWEVSYFVAAPGTRGGKTNFIQVIASTRKEAIEYASEKIVILPGSDLIVTGAERVGARG